MQGCLLLLHFFETLGVEPGAGSCIRKQVRHSLSYAVLPQEKKPIMHVRQIIGLKFEATVTLASSSPYFEHA